MTNPSEWVATPGPAGLIQIAWNEDGRTRRVVVRARKVKSGRLKVSELHVQDPTPTGLRELRLGAVEQLVNTHAIRDALLARMDESAADVFSEFAGRVHVKAGAGVAGSSAGGTVTLERPTRLDDDFYRQVLRARDHATARGAPILQTLMDASGAPRSTVARWLAAALSDEKRLRAGATG